MQLLQAVENWFIPHYCVFCHCRSDTEINLCSACRADLPWLSNTCCRCALPLTLSTETTPLLCGACLRSPPYFSHTLALLAYQDRITHLINAIKFSGNLLYANLIGKLLSQHISQHYTAHQSLPECIIPVPLHKQRLRGRGFNQALEIAHPVAKKLAIPVDHDCCQRNKMTVAQAQTSAIERKQNIRGAFTVKGRLHYQHVAIIDDVITTGHTVNELSHCLLAAGVTKVSVWCIARTILERKSH